MTVPFFDLTRQNHALDQEIKTALTRVVDAGRYILGENVSALEREVAAYHGTKYAVAVASGTDALHLALRASGLKPGDEVITTPFTFVATAEAIEYCGAKPVFVDIEPNTFNIDPARIKSAITKKTKAVLPVHLFGQSCQMDQIMDIACNNGINVIEDCAQAFGAAFKGKKVGSLGLAGCHSFFPTKNLGCFGDGGIITTNSEDLANEARVLRGHGSRVTYHYDVIGFNSRLDELQAAVLRVKLPHVDSYIKLRRRNANLYLKHLKSLSGLKLPFEGQDCLHTFNQFTIRVEGRNQLFEFLKTHNIPAMVYYPLSLHLQKVFSPLKHRIGSFPASETAQEAVISLPIFPELSPAEIESVCAILLEYFKQ